MASQTTPLKRPRIEFKDTAPLSGQGAHIVTLYPEQNIEPTRPPLWEVLTTEEYRNYQMDRQQAQLLENIRTQKEKPPASKGQQHQTVVLSPTWSVSASPQAKGGIFSITQAERIAQRQRQTEAQKKAFQL